MAHTKSGTITKIFTNNSPTPTVVAKTVELVVVDNVLVPDFRETNPGVICGLVR